ncbi:hypothetical protein [Cytobacillus gottheilii]|uniref:hypothetical protein n=1 Tax=Cytobacillus gottheilii TaxID=859144 RepID=UPI0024949532|nr:hypothetical protein [Cytobacillus gottheilii]
MIIKNGYLEFRSQKEINQARLEENKKAAKALNDRANKMIEENYKIISKMKVN